MRLAMDGVEEGTGMGSGGESAPTSTVMPAAYILWSKESKLSRCGLCKSPTSTTFSSSSFVFVPPVVTCFPSQTSYFTFIPQLVTFYLMPFIYFHLSMLVTF